MPARLLLLEDDPAIARTVAYALEREGLAVTHSLLVHEARQQMRQQPVDLLVLDVGLPDGSGLDLLRELRGAPATATLPVRLALEHTDWRGLFILLGVLIACSGLLIWLVTPREASLRQAKAPTVKSVFDVYRAAAFRKPVALILIPHTVFFGIQGLWIGRWLADVAHFSDAAVAYLLYMSMAAVIFGAIAVGLITEAAARRGIRPLDLAAGGIALFVLVQVAIVCNHAPSFQLLAVLFTLLGTITGMEYTIVAQSLPREMTGRAATCLNLLIFIGAFLVQAGFGQIIGLWRPDVLGHYPAIAYQVAFGVLVLLQLPGLVSYVLGRRPVKCASVTLILKEEYEISPLRPSR